MSATSAQEELFAVLAFQLASWGVPRVVVTHPLPARTRAYEAVAPPHPKGGLRPGTAPHSVMMALGAIVHGVTGFLLWAAQRGGGSELYRVTLALWFAALGGEALLAVAAYHLLAPPAKPRRGEMRLRRALFMGLWAVLLMAPLLALPALALVRRVEYEDSDNLLIGAIFSGIVAPLFVGAQRAAFAFGFLPDDAEDVGTVQRDLSAVRHAGRALLPHTFSAAADGEDRRRR